MYAYYISPGQKGRFSHNAISYMVLVDASYLNMSQQLILCTMNNALCLSNQEAIFSSLTLCSLSELYYRIFLFQLAMDCCRSLKKTVIKIDKKEALVMDLVLL